jgi:hypothetical protein
MGDQCNVVEKIILSAAVRHLHTSLPDSEVTDLMGWQ